MTKPSFTSKISSIQKAIEDLAIVSIKGEIKLVKLFDTTKFTKNKDRQILKWVRRLVHETQSDLAIKEELGLRDVESLTEWLSVIRKSRYKCDEYDILEDIMNHGCNTGILPEVVYHCQINVIFGKFETEIFEIIKEYEEDTGSNIVGKIWKEQGYYQGFIQSLVWTAIEIVADRLYNECLDIDYMDK